MPNIIPQKKVAENGCSSWSSKKKLKDYPLKYILSLSLVDWFSKISRIREHSQANRFRVKTNRRLIIANINPRTRRGSRDGWISLKRFRTRTIYTRDEARVRTDFSLLEEHMFPSCAIEWHSCLPQWFIPFAINASRRASRRLATKRRLLSVHETGHVYISCKLLRPLREPGISRVYLEIPLRPRKKSRFS